MTGLESVREEMKKRGATPSMMNSKTVAMVLDICMNSGTVYTDLKEAQDARKTALIEAGKYRYALEHDKKAQLERIESQRTEVKEMVDYIKRFNEALTECETPEGRDAMRRAQIYRNSISIETKYDNTAFIIAMGCILSNGTIGPIEAYRELNPKLPWSWERL